MQASLGGNTDPPPFVDPSKGFQHGQWGTSGHTHPYLRVVAATARSGTGTVPLVRMDVGVLGAGEQWRGQAEGPCPWTTISSEAVSLTGR